MRKISKKLTFLTPWCAHICVRIRGYEMLVFGKCCVRTKWRTCNLRYPFNIPVTVKGLFVSIDVCFCKYLNVPVIIIITSKHSRVHCLMKSYNTINLLHDFCMLLYPQVYSGLPQLYKLDSFPIVVFFILYVCRGSDYSSNQKFPNSHFSRCFWSVLQNIYNPSYIFNFQKCTQCFMKWILKNFLVYHN